MPLPRLGSLWGPEQGLPLMGKTRKWRHMMERSYGQAYLSGLMISSTSQDLQKFPPKWGRTRGRMLSIIVGVLFLLKSRLREREEIHFGMKKRFVWLQLTVLIDMVISMLYSVSPVYWMYHGIIYLGPCRSCGLRTAGLPSRPVWLLRYYLEDNGWMEMRLTRFWQYCDVRPCRRWFNPAYLWTANQRKTFQRIFCWEDFATRL